MSEMVTPRSKFDLANASFEFRARNLKNQEKEREGKKRILEEEKRCRISHHFKRIKEIGAEKKNSAALFSPRNCPVLY